MSSIVYSLGAPAYPVLDAYFRCRESVSVIIGPLGSGKTYVTAQRVFKQMCEQAPNAAGIRPSRWMAIRNVYGDLMSTTARDWQAVLRGPNAADGDMLGTFRMGGFEPPAHTLDFMLSDGTRVKSEMMFLALDREDAVRKLRGYQLTGIWLSETKELHKSVVDMADGRHGRYPSMADGGVMPTWSGMLGDSNAPDDDHWLYRLAEEEHPKGWAFFKQPGGVVREGDGWRVNPGAENLMHLPRGYYERMVAGKSRAWVSVNLANEYGSSFDGKPVHPEYVDDVHCLKELPPPPEPGDSLLLGFDFGRTPAAAIVHWNGGTGRYTVIDEFVTGDMSAALFAPELKLYLDRTYPGCVQRGWGDPAGDHAGQATEDTPLRILRANGILAFAAPSNEIVLRRAAVSNPLTRLCMDGRPALLVSPRAKMIRKGLQGGFCYRRIQTTGERYTDVPDKNEYSHPVEALEYALMGGGEGRAALRPPKYLQDQHGDRPALAEM